MSLTILVNSVQELPGKNEYFTVNISTIIKLVLEKNYHVDSISEKSKNQQKRKVLPKRSTLHKVT